MIKPTNGRVVWFTPGESDRRKIAQHDPAQKLAATIVHVWGDRCVNLAILDSNGNAHQRTSVTLVQDGDPCDPHNGYAEWMPYQKGQAAKTEQLEQAATRKDQVAAPGRVPGPTFGSFDVLVEQIAVVCHQVNRAYCQSQGDESQPDWPFAPDWQRDSARKGVRYALENPSARPSDSHESWLAEKHVDGWTYGEVKDPEKKQHPCFVPYDELPAAQKAKDYIFLAIVRSLAPMEFAP